MSKVWLVTGSASGLGRHIADAVLASGDSWWQRRATRADSTIWSGSFRVVRTAALDVRGWRRPKRRSKSPWTRRRGSMSS